MITFTLPDDDAAMVLKMLLALTMIAEGDGKDIEYPLQLLEVLTRQTEMQIAAVNDNVSVH